MQWKYTNGFEPTEFATTIAIEDDYELKADEKDIFLSFACSAASKTLTLGLKDGQFMVVANIGASNAVTVANLDGDTGSSVAAGKVALVIGSSTADGTKIYVLN